MIVPVLWRNRHRVADWINGDTKTQNDPDPSEGADQP